MLRREGLTVTPTKDQFFTGSKKYEAIYEALKLMEKNKPAAALMRMRWAMPDTTMEQLKMTVTMNEMGGLFAYGRITPKGREYYQKMIHEAKEMAE